MISIYKMTDGRGYSKLFLSCTMTMTYCYGKADESEVNGGNITTLGAVKKSVCCTCNLDQDVKFC